MGSVFALIGGLVLLWREGIARKISLTLVSFAAGALIGAAFLDLLPEALDTLTYERVALTVIVGILTIFIFEKFLKWYHCHDQEVCDYHTFSSTVLFGDAVHNFIDGIVIAASFSVNVGVGIATTIAIFFHEVPQEIGDFGVLLHAGYSKAKVFFYNLLTAFTTVVGAMLGYLALSWATHYIGWLLAFAAGTFIYISVSDLLPELRHRSNKPDILHVAAVVAGVAVIWLVGIYFPE